MNNLIQIRVYYEDTDISGFVYHSNYLKYCERARSEIFFQKGLSPISGTSHFVVSKLEAKFLKSAKFGDLLQVKTETIKIKGFSIELLQTIFRGDELIFEAKITLAHLKGEKLAKIDKNIRELFEIL